MQDTLSYAVAFLFAAVLALAIMLLLAENRMRKILKGKSTDIESTVVNLHKDVADLAAFRSEVEKYLKTVEKRLHKSIQGKSVVRFSAFGKPDGGNQSFATALLDENGDGVVISSLQARDVVGVYAKPVEKNASRFELSAEEKEALSNASKDVRS